MENHRELWSAFADRYDTIVDLQLGGRTREIVRQRLRREGPLGRAIEIGCGTGYFTGALAERAETLLATDISEGMLTIARQAVTAGNVEFRIEDAQGTTLPAGSFDTAFMALVIQFTDPPATLAEMRRILRPGGTLILANLDPMALPPFNRTRAVLRVLYHALTGYRVKPPRGFGRKVLTEPELRELLRAASFRVESVEPAFDRSRSSNVPVEYVRATSV